MGIRIVVLTVLKAPIVIAKSHGWRAAAARPPGLAGDTPGAHLEAGRLDSTSGFVIFKCGGVYGLGFRLRV